jgi:hypothetical protein
VNLLAFIGVSNWLTNNHYLRKCPADLGIFVLTYYSQLKAKIA